jgi:hypothetical protein
VKQPPKLAPLTIKDAMVKREVDHLRSMGATPSMADVDRYATAQLERAAAKNADSRLKALTRHQRKQRKHRSSIAEQEATRAGYRFRQVEAGPPKPTGPKFVSVCACGGCIQCRRESRMKEIMRLGLAGDERLQRLAWEIVMVGMRAKAQTGDFKDVALGIDRARMVTREIEDINDRSVPIMGEWR